MVQDVIDVFVALIKAKYGLLALPRYFALSYLLYCRLLQSENAEPPMLVMLFGIVTLVSPLQPENAEFPMLVTLFGIVILVSPLQP